MKKLTLLCSFFCLLVQACNSNRELSRKEALEQIKQEKNFPKVADFDIYCSDAMHVRKVVDGGLESSGMVMVLKTQKLGDLNKPLITLTDKAQPFLLPTPEKDKALDIQKVKLADEELVEITNIRMNGDGNKAVVDYTTAFKNLTPFVALTNVDAFKKKKTNKAYFAFGDDGWKLEKKPGVDFLELEK